MGFFEWIFGNEDNKKEVSGENQQLTKKEYYKNYIQDFIGRGYNYMIEQARKIRLYYGDYPLGGLPFKIRKYQSVQQPPAPYKAMDLHEIEKGFEHTSRWCENQYEKTFFNKFYKYVNSYLSADVSLEQREKLKILAQNETALNNYYREIEEGEKEY